MSSQVLRDLRVNLRVMDVHRRPTLSEVCMIRDHLSEQAEAGQSLSTLCTLQ